MFAVGCAWQRWGWAPGQKRVLWQGPWAGSGDRVGVEPERVPVLAGDPWGAEGVEALRKAGGQVRASQGPRRPTPGRGCGSLLPLQLQGSLGVLGSASHRRYSRAA